MKLNFGFGNNAHRSALPNTLALTLTLIHVSRLEPPCRPQIVGVVGDSGGGGYNNIEASKNGNSAKLNPDESGRKLQ